MFETMIDAYVLDAMEDLNGVPDDQIDKLVKWLETIFELWKLECGDRDPKGAGLLGAGRVEFSEAAPFHCAGHGVLNNIDLTLKLWAENYPPMVTLIEKISLRRTFAALIVRQARPGMYNSILQARDLIHSLDKGTKEFAEQQVRELLPDACSWQKRLATQKQNASRPRSPVTNVIKKLERINPDARAKELWCEFLGYDDGVFRVKERNDGSAEWEYSPEDTNRQRSGSIKFAAFEVALSKIRGKKLAQPG